MLWPAEGQALMVVVGEEVEDKEVYNEDKVYNYNDVDDKSKE